MPPPPPFIPIPPFMPLNDINTEQGSRQHEQQKTWTHPRTDPSQEKLSQISQQDYSTHPPPMPPPIPPDFMPPPPPFIPIPPFMPLRSINQNEQDAERKSETNRFEIHTHTGIRKV